jgi:hypothetical protein
LVVAGALAVWPFLFDSSLTFLSRPSRGENVFAAHRSHLYQRLVIVGYSHRRVSSLYIGLAVAGVVLAAAYLTEGPAMQIAIAEGELRIANCGIANCRKAKSGEECRIANCELRIANLRFLIRNLKFAIQNPQFAIRNSQFPFVLFVADFGVYQV